MFGISDYFTSGSWLKFAGFGGVNVPVLKFYELQLILTRQHGI